LKKLLNSLLKGFCFGIGLLVAVFVAYKSEIFENNERFSESDKHVTQSIKAALEDIENVKLDNCNGIEGSWGGQREEEDGGIRTWHQQFKPDGVFNGQVTFTSPDRSNSNKQVGTWSCINSVLFTTVEDEDYKRMYNYLILSTKNDTKVLSYIGNHKYPRTYIYKKEAP